MLLEIIFFQILKSQDTKLKYIIVVIKIHNYIHLCWSFMYLLCSVVAAGVHSLGPRTSTQGSLPIGAKRGNRGAAAAITREQIHEVVKMRSGTVRPGTGSTKRGGRDSMRTRGGSRTRLPTAGTEDTAPAAPSRLDTRAVTRLSGETDVRVRPALASGLVSWTEEAGIASGYDC